jgi:hypothetical protein
MGAGGMMVSVHDERGRCREEKTLPLIADLKAWLETILPKLSAKTDLAAAMPYAIGRWDALTRYIHNGRVEIDNNAADRSIRGIALGRENYLFAGSDTIAALPRSSPLRQS